MSAGLKIRAEHTKSAGFSYVGIRCMVPPFARLTPYSLSLLGAGPAKEGGESAVLIGKERFLAPHFRADPNGMTGKGRRAASSSVQPRQDCIDHCSGNISWL